MIDRKSFFDHVRSRPFGGWLNATQVQGMEKILDEWERQHLSDIRWLAYMLATTFHETSKAMWPVREMGGESYLRSKPYYPWVGEGLVQVTWEANARKFGAKQPGDLMSWPVALRALFDGMFYGKFTGHKLDDYFNDRKNDPIGARRIVNGTDKAALIAGYHTDFLLALNAVGALIKPIDKPVVPPITSPGPLVPVAAKTAPAGFWRGLWASLTGKAA